MVGTCSRRQAIQSAAALGLGLVLPKTSSAAREDRKSIRYCLNTSTIRGHELGVEEEIDLIAAAGYDSVELWIREITRYQEQGGKLADLKRRMDDRGITLESAIGFAQWILDDPVKRRQGLETLKRDMDLVSALGGQRIAAPPAGATEVTIDLNDAADRYRAALELGDQTGVRPQLELWGFSKSLSKLGELMYVATECAHPKAGLLLDIYHIYKGGSDFGGLAMIPGEKVEVLHMNDYPNIPHDTIGDSDRVFPGAGVAPVTTILGALFDSDFAGVLSLELFNREYWKQDVKQVLGDGLAAMRQAVEAA